MRGLNSRQRISAVALALVAVAFITLDVAGGDLRDAHGGARGVLGGLYRGTDAAIGPVRRFLQGVPDVSSDRSRIAALQRENAQLRKQVAASSVDAATAAQLKKLQLAAGNGLTVLPTRVIAFGPGQGFDWTITLDAGRGSGIAVGQTVTDGAALVGRVLHVDASSSVVLLAADPGSGVGVRDARDGQLGIATGAGSKGFTLAPLDPAADLKAGDQLVSGPAGQSSFVAGFAVGTITSVQRSADGATVATVRAATSPTALDLVGVVITGGSTAARGALVAGGG